jgi:hypothetical protein
VVRRWRGDGAAAEDAFGASCARRSGYGFRGGGAKAPGLLVSVGVGVGAAGGGVGGVAGVAGGGVAGGVGAFGAGVVVGVVAGLGGVTGVGAVPDLVSADVGAVVGAVAPGARAPGARDSRAETSCVSTDPATGRSGSPPGDAVDSPSRRLATVVSLWCARSWAHDPAARAAIATRAAKTARRGSSLMHEQRCEARARAARRNSRLPHHRAACTTDPPRRHRNSATAGATSRCVWQARHGRERPAGAGASTMRTYWQICG